MGLFEVTLTQSFAQQQIINRWTYEGIGTPASVSMSFALTSALGAIESVGVYPPTGMMRTIASIQAAAVTFDLITIKNLYSVTDFYSTPFVTALVGADASAGEAMSPAVAYGFRTNRVRSDVRRATKRFVGVGEGRVGSLGVISAGFVSGNMGPVAAKMGEVLQYVDEGNTLTFSPIVCGKERYNPDTGLADPNGRAYRYFGTEAAQLQHVARSVIWDAYNTVRTQTSRQYGRGR